MNTAAGHRWIIAQGRVRFQMGLLWTLLLLLVLWAIKVYELRVGVSFSDYGLYPREPRGLLGLITMPFLHGDFQHLYNNSFGLLILGVTLFYFYPRVAWRVLLISPPVVGVLLWFFARPAYHIGASGLVYTLSAFLFLSGCLRNDKQSRGGAMIVALLYGGSVWGIFPLQEGVSWEGHLFGALIGAYLAALFRDVDLPPRPVLGDDEQDDMLEYEAFPYWQLDHPEGEDEHRGGTG